MHRIAIRLVSGLPSGVAPCAHAIAQTWPVKRSRLPDPFAVLIAEASQRFGVPEPWIRSVLRAESAGDVRAISPAGAMGLIQVMPDTWAELRAHHRLGDDPFEPRDNIHTGTAYLGELLDRYGSVSAMLAAHNTGPVRYDEHLSAGSALPAETQAYVALIAPLLGGGPLPKSIAAPASVSADWRDAPPFVAPFADTASAAPVQPDGHRDVDRSVGPEPGQTPIAPHSEGLLVARSGSERAP